MAPDNGEPSVRLQIDQKLDGGGLSDQWGSTLFEPQRDLSNTREKSIGDITPGESAGASSSSSFSSPSSDSAAPEKKLTLLALRLAILEKAASGIGTLGFIWATVVLLGGFAITLDKVDFWVITTILLIEGARIFSRSRELEWQHQATWSLADRHSFRALKFFFFRRANTKTKQEPSMVLERQRTWKSSDVPFIPYAGWFSLSSNISRLLYWLQLLSATACVILSLVRLVRQDYGEVAKGETDKRNRKSALNIFYGLALAEALLFLLEKAYWEWKVVLGRLLDEVNTECGLGGNAGIVSIKRFFYDAYSRCVNGSIFDGIKMDLVSFAVELLASDSHDEQLIGARILQRFSTNDRFADETLRKIGTSTAVIERLIEMLNWKNPAEEEIRRYVAEILSKLAGKKRNALRVAGIPGAMESISSLLYTGREGAGSEKPGECYYDYSEFNLLGLLILKKLAHDHDNCGKIGNTRGLLPKIIGFTGAGERLLRDDRAAESQIRAVKRSLQVVKMLVGTTGITGEALRREISEIVFTVGNIREILQYGDSHMMLQKLGIEILTSLALDAAARGKIGATGRMVRELVGIFFRPGMLTDVQNSVRVAAGEALAMLALESEGNCDRILRVEGVVESLVEALGDSVIRVDSARILRNLCAHGGTECYARLRGVTTAIPTVLKAIMSKEKKLLEESIGLATQIFRFTSPEEQAQGFEMADIRTSQELVQRLVQILKTHDRPSIKVPRIRRFVMELAIWMMRSNAKNIALFRHHGMVKELENVAETTSELECFNVFSGSVGLSRHHTTVHSLVDTALGLIADAGDH